MSQEPGVRTAVVATVGPACAERDVLRRLIEAGAGILRLNLSHGDLDGHLRTLALVREIEAELGIPVGVMADLPGPKIRIHAADVEHLVDGTGLDIVEPDRVSDATGPVIAIDAPQVLNSVEPGHRILLDDGNIRLLVIRCSDEEGGRRVRCTVTSGGDLRSRVGVNLPDSDPDLPAVTPRDLDFALAMRDAGVDLIAVSFVRDGDDLRRLRAALEDSTSDGQSPGLVSKIERPGAITHLDDVVEASDAVLVARGDLGVELDIAEVPVLQKRVIAAAVRAGRPVIVATQMLQSMMTQPSPTRAEATDAANAVLDGADALMLSGETAIGRHPVLAVETLRRIARRTEQWHDDMPYDHVQGLDREVAGDPWLPAIARGAHRIAAELPVTAMVAWSQTGATALVLSRGDLRVPLVVLTDDPASARRMRLLHGVLPVPVDSGLGLGADRAAFLTMAKRSLVDLGIAEDGDACVFVHGSRREIGRPTDSVGVFSVRGDEAGE